VRAGATPVHKLNWRQDCGHAVAGSNLELLLDATGARRGEGTING